MSRRESKTLQQVAEGTHYPIDAFHFVRRGLDFTVLRIHEDARQLPDDQRHVTGKQLSEGLRNFSVDQYGYMAKVVLHRWRITRTSDFGRIVFAMVEGGLMQATESDSIRDFESVYNFEDALETAVALDRIPHDGLPATPVHSQNA